MLQKKLFIIYSSMITVIVILFLILMNQTLFHIMDENVKSDNEAIISQWELEFEQIIQTSKSSILDLCLEEQTQEYLRSPQASLPPKYLTPQLHKGQLLADVKFFPFDGKSFFYPGKALSSKRKDWFLRNEQQNGSFLITVLEENSAYYLTISKLVYDTSNWDQVIGILSAEYGYDLINAAILGQIKLNNKGRVYMADQETRSLLPYGVSASSYLRKAILSGDNSYVTSSHYMIERQIEGTPFYLIGSIPLEEIQAAGTSVYRTVIASGIFAILICLIGSWIVSRSFTRPIMSLADVMANIKEGDLDVSLPNTYSGEIGTLYTSFNYMIRMIHKLINDNYRITLRKKQSELDALQSQINAHFLYNTLDSINWLARKYNALDISKMVTSLSRLLRLSLNNGENITTIEKDVAHAKNYIEIQKIRFPDTPLEVEYIVDESIRSKRILKLLIQPLVENAFNHGFKEDTSEHKLFIICSPCKNGVRLQVKNSGTKIDLSYVHSLINDTSTEPPKSYGIRSISQRLKSHYGIHAHFYFTVDDLYTTATIEIDDLNEGGNANVSGYDRG